MHSWESLPAIVNRKVQTTPHDTFVRTVDGPSATWDDVHSAMNLWSARFLTLGVQRDDVVVTILDAGLESMGAWLGLTSIGAIDAATNHEFRGRMLAYAINNCRPRLLVVSAQYLPLVDAVADDLTSVESVLLLGDGGAHDGSRLPAVVRPDELLVDTIAARHAMTEPQRHDIACISYTSGTTGPSKAVMLPWGQLHSINTGTFPLEDLDSSDVFYCTTAHAHFGSKSIPYHAAMVGGQVVQRPRFALNSFWGDIARYGITTGMLVGSMAVMLLRSPDSPTAATSLKNLFMAPLGPCYQEFSAKYDTRICTVYNSTESGVPIHSGWNPSNERTVGRLREGYPGFDVRLVDDNDVEVPDGTPGECIVRSSEPWVMNAGYFNDGAATARAWRNGWFHTGDVLRRTPDGDYVFVDRVKDVIRRRGENISSYEVEADVLRHPDVVECAAVAVPAVTSEDEILLFVVKRDGASLTAAELCDELADRVARFMVPRYVEFVPALPKTQATQRIVKSELRARGVGQNTWDREQSDVSAQPMSGGRRNRAIGDRG